MIVDRRRANRERRQQGRVFAVFGVRAQVGQTIQLAQCEDLAPTGMRLRRPGGLPLAPGVQVQLSFELPGQAHALTVTAEVATDTREGRFRQTGLRLLSLQPEVSAAIARYCRGAETPGWQSDEAAAAAAW